MERQFIDKKWWLIGETGIPLIKFNWFCPWSYGMAAVQKNENGKWGYLDENGNLVIDYQFDAAGFFDETGHANVSNNCEWFSIDCYGDIIGPPTSSLDKNKIIIFPNKIGDKVYFLYKDGMESGIILKINKEKQTFTVELDNGKKIWRYWNYLKQGKIK